MLGHSEPVALSLIKDKSNVDHKGMEDRMVQLAVRVYVYPIYKDRISRYLSTPQNLFDWENYFLQGCEQMSNLRTSGITSWCQWPSGL